MSRLTKRKKDGKAIIDMDVGKDLTYPQHMGLIQEKLAHYEDLEAEGRLIELLAVYEDGFGVGFRDDCFDFTRRKLGETAFLTKDEAEQKLAELQSLPTLPIWHGNVAPSSKEEAMERLGLRDKLSELKGE